MCRRSSALADGRRKKWQVQPESGPEQDRVELAGPSVREVHVLSIHLRDPWTHIDPPLGHERQEVLTQCDAASATVAWAAGAP
jgi:hypothetical protein